MSFGLLKHFKDLKKNVTESSALAYAHHVILGQDLGAVLKLVEVLKNHPGETVKIISPRVLNKQLLVENHEFGVSQLRSESAVTEIFKKHFDLKVSSQAKEALFYKDGKFHEFSGRAKPMELMAGEEFFTHKGSRIEVASLFDTETWENLDQILATHLELRILEGIEKTTPSELVEKKEWILSFKDYKTLSCEYLYVSLSPKKFLGHLHNKEKLTPELIDVCSAVEVQTAISVTWSLTSEIYPETQTLFIPQSMTHEWGHFVVEFEPYDFSRKEQLCHVLFLIHEEDPQTEDLGSKIKLMKRVLDRVFPKIEESIKKEFIRFDEEMFVTGIKDEMIEQLGFDYPTLKLIGQNSPMQSQNKDEKFLARTLLN